MFCGATFLPPAVTRMSFLRSVIVRKPSSSIEPMSPVLQPAVVAEHRLRRLGILVVAGEHRGAADEQLPVVGELAGRCRACAGPTVPKRKRSSMFTFEAVVHSVVPVALQDRDVEHVEELRDLLRRAARRRRSRTSAARRASSSPSSRPAGPPAGAARRARAGRAALLAQLADPPADVERPVDQLPLDARSPRRSSRARPCAPSRRRAGRSAAPSAAPIGATSPTRSGSGQNAVVKPT